jgi:glycosyltransferase involved in cell wall biosynthesis
VASDHPLRVCYFGTYREDYSRNQMMIAGLRMNGVIVTECHETLWHGIEDRVRIASGEWSKPSFWWRIIKAYWNLCRNYLKVGDYDILVVGYPGQLDVFVARFLAWWKHKPLVWDIFMSIYLIAVERGLDKKSYLSIKLLHSLERIALKLPDDLVIDTKEYAEWFQHSYGIRLDRFDFVPTGADERIFYPRDDKYLDDDKFRVLYYGTFIPNHGVEYIIKAAHILEGEPQILFELIGTGPEELVAKQYVAEHKLKNVIFFDWLEKDRLVARINQADICLGVFGITPQSLMTIQNKIYEGLAMARPVLSGDSPAVRQALTHGKNIFLCERANPTSLANAIRSLYANPELCQSLAQNGHEIFVKQFSIARLGEKYLQHLNTLVNWN